MTHNEFPYKADALAFISPQARPPIAADGLASHVDLMHVTAAPPPFDQTEAILNGARMRDGREVPGVLSFATALTSQPELRIVGTQSDLVLAGKQGRTGVILGLQQAPHDANEGDNLSRLYAAGVRVMALGYRDSGKRFGSGWMDPEGSLTDDGRRLLEKMADTYMTVDVSHSGERTASDALDFILEEGLPLPVMASHGGIYENYDGNWADANNRRNLSRETLGKVDYLGGVVGIYSLTFGLSHLDDSPEPFYAQLHEAVALFPDTASIGSDAVYAERGMLEWEQTSAFLARTIAAGTDMRPRHPDTPAELNTPARLQVVGDRLVYDGMSHEQAARLVGGNLLRFFAESLPT